MNKTWLSKILGNETIELLKTEETFYLAETKLKDVIIRAGIILWEWDSETDNIKWLGNYEELFGYSQGTFNGTYSDVKSCIHPEDLGKFTKGLETARDKGRNYADEFRIVWPDGTTHWVSGWGWFDYNAQIKFGKMYGALIPG